MASIFSRIINREIPCYKIAEDNHYFAFLDISPLKKGHTLVVPKKEVDYLFDLDDATYQGLLLFSSKIAKAIKKSVPCKRVAMHVIGLEVPHAHIHLVPINTMNDSNFSNEKLKLTSDEMKSTAELIASNL